MSGGKMAYLELRNIGKIYASEGGISVGIRKVSLAFDKGEFVAITGKSGAGKTTLLNIIGGMETYEEGEMYLHGAPTSPYTLREWEAYQAENISYIFQNYNILDSFTVLENVEFALLTIEDLKERRAKALEIIERVGLKERVHMRGSQLSGGEKQRTVIARAIAKDSPIILADEPTGNLDSKTAKDILELLHEISKGKLVIVVTHSYEDLQEYATRHVRIYDGEVESDEILSGEKAQFASKDGEADFTVEHKIIFRNKEKKDKLRGKRSKRIRDAALLGFKRFTSRPKQAILMSSILTVAMICVICVLGFLPVQELFGRKSAIAINPIEGRVMVADRDGTGYTQEEAAELVTKYGATSYIWNDYYLDRILYVNLTQSRYESKQLPFTISITGMGNKRVQYGRAPEAVGEVALRIPYCYRGDWNIGDSISFLTALRFDNFTENKTITCKIVGLSYYVDNRKTAQVEMTRETFDSIALLSRQKFSIEWDRPQLPGVSEENRLPQYLAFELKFTLEPEECILTYPDRKAVSGATFQLLSFGKEVELNITEEKQKYSIWYPELCTLTVGADFLSKLSVESSSQISLMFADQKTAKQQMQQMQTDGLRVLLARDVELQQNRSMGMDEMLGVLTQALLTLLVALVMAGTLVLTLSKLILATKGDVAIFRTMGIPEKTVKISTYIQLLCAWIPACVISLVMTLVIYFTALGKYFVYIGFGSGMLMVAALGLILWLLGLGYNRILYSVRVKKGLRRVNK